MFIIILKCDMNKTENDIESRYPSTSLWYIEEWEYNMLWIHSRSEHVCIVCIYMYMYIMKEDIQELGFGLDVSKTQHTHKE